MARRKYAEICCATCEYLHPTFTLIDGELWHHCELVEGIPEPVRISKVWTTHCTCWEGKE